jgi:ABC-type multidrug transport system fused ATPase/permease subunit
VEDPKNPKTPKFESTLELANVGFSYVEGSEVLSNVSLKINKGETIAFVGPSGAGKTTITDLIARFYDVSSGAILLDGIDIREFNQEDLRQLVGIVNQESILFNDTIRNNVALGRPELTMEQVESAAKAAYAHDFIMEMEKGYESEIGERGGKLSGGQKQRLSIARALLKDPEILILDEATSALDSESERLIQSALHELMKSRTTFVVAHRLSTVKEAHLILVLEDGVIVESGTHRELVGGNGTYRRLYDAQSFIPDDEPHLKIASE